MVQRNFPTFAYLHKWSTFLRKKVVWSLRKRRSAADAVCFFQKGKMTSNDVSGKSIHNLRAPSRYLFLLFLERMDRTSFPALLAQANNFQRPRSTFSVSFPLFICSNVLHFAPAYIVSGFSFFRAPLCFECLTKVIFKMYFFLPQMSRVSVWDMLLA